MNLRNSLRLYQNSVELRNIELQQDFYEKALLTKDMSWRALQARFESRLPYIFHRIAELYARM